METVTGSSTVFDEGVNIPSLVIMLSVI